MDCQRVQYNWKIIDWRSLKKMWTLNESGWFNNKKVYNIKDFKEVTQLNANNFADSWGTEEFFFSKT